MEPTTPFQDPNTMALFSSVAQKLKDPNTARGIHANIDEGMGNVLPPLKKFEDTIIKPGAHYLVNQWLGSPEEIAESNEMEKLPSDSPVKKEFNKRKMMDLAQKVSFMMGHVQAVPGISKALLNKNLTIEQLADQVRGTKPGEAAARDWEKLSKSNPQMAENQRRIESILPSQEPSKPLSEMSKIEKADYFLQGKPPEPPSDSFINVVKNKLQNQLPMSDEELRVAKMYLTGK